MWKILCITLTDAWPQMQLSLTDGAEVRVLVGNYREGKRTPAMELPKDGPDPAGVVEHARRHGADFRVYLGQSHLQPLLDWCDFAVLDSNDVPKHISRALDKSHKPCLYNAPSLRGLETDRAAGKRFCEAGGLRVVNSDSTVTCSVEELRGFITARQWTGGTNPPVVKSEEVVQLPRTWVELDSVLALFDDDDVLYLEPNLLPDSVAEGAFASYFNGTEFAPVVIFNQEHKAVHDHPMANLMCGEAGTTIITLPPTHSKAAPYWQELLAFVPALTDAGYRGFVDFNCMHMRDGSHIVLEPTLRPGFPTEILIRNLVAKYSSHSVADFMAWQAGLMPLAEPVPTYCVSLSAAVMSVCTGIKTAELPVVPVVNRNDSDPNVSLLPGVCTLDANGDPLSCMHDRTAFAVATWHSDPNSFNTFALRKVEELGDDLQRYSRNILAYGHHMRANLADRSEYPWW